MRKDIVIKLLYVEFDENGVDKDKFVIQITENDDTRIYKIPVNGEIKIKNYLETGIEVDA